jgi:protein-S-isoprenylcysteine O-methyltransferase Ste14
MALIDSFEKSGNTLFRYRGQIPAILFIIAVPVIYYTDYTIIPVDLYYICTILSIALCVAGFLIRSYAIGTTPKGTSGRNTKEQVAETLNVSGIYSVVRHPLYLGNYLMWAGITAFTFNLYFFIFSSLAFWLYYERIMFAEERFLERKYGEKYLEWSMTVPAFIPALRLYKKSLIPFSFKIILKREYSGVLAAAFGFAFVDILRIYFTENIIEWQRASVYTAAVALILAIVLRTLKHSNILNEEGRS